MSGSSRADLVLAAPGETQGVRYPVSAGSKDEDWSSVGQYVAIDCPEYLFDLDDHRGPNGEQMLFVGLRVRKWSKSVLKEMLRNFKLFRTTVHCPLYIIPEVDDAKWESFAAFFGFRFLINVVCENGETRRLFINLKEETHDHFDAAENGQHHPADQPLGSSGSVPDAGLRSSV